MFNLQSKKFRDNLSKDILNRLGFAWTVNDLIFKFRSFEIDNKKYKKDRGYAFEEQLNENTENVLNKKLFEYYNPEKESQIPMLILSPTIVNDGRRLLISPQPISYLTNLKPQSTLRNNYIHESVEFTRLFKEQEARNLRFSSALRMSSTFPYVMPIVHLPSEPEIQIMDAGIRDNFGMQTTLKFLYTYRKWLEMNTSGVVILQIRDLEKNKESNVLSKGEIEKCLRTGEAPERLELQRIINEIIKHNLSIFEFEKKLKEKKVNIKLNASQEGKISGISFEFKGKTYKGSHVNRSLSWNKLKIKLYEQDRIDPIILQNTGRIKENQRKTTRFVQSVNRNSQSFNQESTHTFKENRGNEIKKNPRPRLRR